MPIGVWYDMQFGFVGDNETEVSEREVKEIAGSDCPHSKEYDNEEVGIQYDWIKE